jgi:DNA invertase Pin-like site-specific DNA recombinase
MYGLQSQLDACHSRAKERGWTITREISDDQTGSDMFRPGLTEVRRLVAAKEVDVVLMYSVDRLSRDTIDVLTVMAELRDRSTVEFVNETFENNPTGRLFLTLRASIGSYEREQILARTQAGRITKAKSGLVPGGRTPYGYRTQDGRYVIHVEEAAVVRRIFEWAAAGVSQREIAHRLTEEGIPPFRASAWGKTSVGRILGHEAYAGMAHYNQRKREKTVLRPRPINEHIDIPVPPIITREVFDAVVTARATNREMLVGRPSRNYMLTGLLRCWCGARMCGDSGSYRCTGRNLVARRKKPCKTQVSARVLDQIVWEDGFLEIMTDPRRLKYAFEQTYKQLQAQWAKRSGKRTALEAKIVKLTANEKRALDMMIEFDSLEDRAAIKARKEEMRAERLRLDAELKAMTPVATMPDVDALVRRMAAIVAGKQTVLERRDILKESCVEITWDGRFPQMHIGFRTLAAVERPPRRSPDDDGKGPGGVRIGPENRSDPPYDRAAGVWQEHVGETLRRHSAPAHLRGSSGDHQDS